MVSPIKPDATKKLRKTLPSKFTECWLQIPVEKWHKKLLGQFVEKAPCNWHRKTAPSDFWESLLEIAEWYCEPQGGFIRKVLRAILNFGPEMRLSSLPTLLQLRMKTFAEGGNDDVITSTPKKKLTPRRKSSDHNSSSSGSSSSSNSSSSSSGSSSEDEQEVGTRMRAELEIRSQKVQDELEELVNREEERERNIEEIQKLLAEKQKKFEEFEEMKKKEARQEEEEEETRKEENARKEKEKEEEVIRKAEEMKKKKEEEEVIKKEENARKAKAEEEEKTRKREDEKAQQIKEEKEVKTRKALKEKEVETAVASIELPPNPIYVDLETGSVLANPKRIPKKNGFLEATAAAAGAKISFLSPLSSEIFITIRSSVAALAQNSSDFMLFFSLRSALTSTPFSAELERRANAEGGMGGFRWVLRESNALDSLTAIAWKSLFKTY